MSTGILTINGRRIRRSMRWSSSGVTSLGRLAAAGSGADCPEDGDPCAARKLAELLRLLTGIEYLTDLSEGVGRLVGSGRGGRGGLAAAAPGGCQVSRTLSACTSRRLRCSKACWMPWAVSGLRRGRFAAAPGDPGVDADLTGRPGELTSQTFPGAAFRLHGRRSAVGLSVGRDLPAHRAVRAQWLSAQHHPGTRFRRRACWTWCRRNVGWGVIRADGTELIQQRIQACGQAIQAVLRQTTAANAQVTRLTARIALSEQIQDAGSPHPNVAHLNQFAPGSFGPRQLNRLIMERDGGRSNGRGLRRN